jgi:hypothetical protein
MQVIGHDILYEENTAVYNGTGEAWADRGCGQGYNEHSLQVCKEFYRFLLPSFAYLQPFKRFVSLHPTCIYLKETVSPKMHST